MKFEEEFTGLIGKGVFITSHDIDTICYEENVIKDCCLDKAKVKEAIEKRRERDNPPLAEDWDFAHDLLKELGL